MRIFKNYQLVYIRLFFVCCSGASILSIWMTRTTELILLVYDPGIFVTGCDFNGEKLFLEIMMVFLSPRRKGGGGYGYSLYTLPLVCPSALQSHIFFQCINFKT